MPRSLATLLPLLAVAMIACGSARTLAAESEGVNRDAQSPPAAERGAKDDDAKKDDDKKSPPKPSVTHSVVTIDGKEIAYTVTAGKMPLATDDGQEKASVFYIAYTVDPFSRDAEGPPAAEREDTAERGTTDDEDDKNDDADKNSADVDAIDKKRPVTFCFNGGPGSSSVWLHLGMLGPVRVKLDSDAGTLPPPHELIANPYSLLDVTDLVFIDPVSTGFSRPAKGENKNQFHGYEQDLRSVGQFIHDYTTKYARWASPKFLLGESYGGIRAAGLAGELRDRYHLELNGLVLVSAVVDFQTLSTSGNNDIAYSLFLPSFAATAWYHDALDDELQDKSVEEIVAEAEEFSTGPYLRALAAGDSLAKNRRRRVIRRMSELTGLSEDYIDAANLRVAMPQFGKELLRDRKRVVGRYDSRYIGIDRDTLGEYAEQDPSAEAVFGTFTSALNDYVRTTLKVDEPRVYEILTGAVQPWDYSEFANRYVNASEALRSAMTQNPFLRVFAACGYYDLATPSYAMEYTRDHLGLDPSLREHFALEFYEGGHMMYIHEPSLEKLREDLVKFYDDTLRQEGE